MKKILVVSPRNPRNYYFQLVRVTQQRISSLIQILILNITSTSKYSKSSSKHSEVIITNGNNSRKKGIFEYKEI